VAHNPRVVSQTIRRVVLAGQPQTDERQSCRDTCGEGRGFYGLDLRTQPLVRSIQEVVIYLEAGWIFADAGEGRCTWPLTPLDPQFGLPRGETAQASGYERRHWL